MHVNSGTGLSWHVRKCKIGNGGDNEGKKSFMNERLDSLIWIEMADLIPMDKGIDASLLKEKVLSQLK